MRIESYTVHNTKLKLAWRCTALKNTLKLLYHLQMKDIYM